MMILLSFVKSFHPVANKGTFEIKQHFHGKTTKKKKNET